MFGYGELIVILLIVLVLFGGKKLPELAKNLGKGIYEFKKATQGLEDEIEATIIHPKEKNDKESRLDKIKPLEEHEIH